MPIVTHSFGQIRPRGERKDQHDAILRDSQHGVFAVVTGSPRTGAGASAAQAVVASIYDEANALSMAIEGVRRDRKNWGGLQKLMLKVFQAASHSIVSQHLSPGLGPTASATLVVIKEGFAAVGHVGRTRAYVLRGSKIVRLTKDAGLPEDDCKIPNTRTALAIPALKPGGTQTIGQEAPIVLDGVSFEAKPSDRIVIVSEGISEVLRGEHLKRLSSLAPDTEAFGESILDLSVARGPKADSSCVVVSVQDKALADEHLEQVLADALEDGEVQPSRRPPLAPSEARSGRARRAAEQVLSEQVSRRPTSDRSVLDALDELPDLPEVPTKGTDLDLPALDDDLPESDAIEPPGAAADRIDPEDDNLEDTETRAFLEELEDWEPDPDRAAALDLPAPPAPPMTDSSQVRLQPGAGRDEEGLRLVSFFEGLSDQQRSRVSALMSSRALTPDELLFQRGDVADRLFVVAEGRLHMLRKARVVDTANPGSVIGATALIEGNVRSWTVKAARRSRVLSLAMSDLRPQLKADPDLALRLFTNLAQLLADQLDELSWSAGP